MNAKRAVIVGVIGVLLIADVAALNVVAAADRTVLDATFVKSTLEEEGAYGELRSLLVESTAEQLTENASGETAGGPTEAMAVDPADVINRSLTRAHLQNQTERNIDGLYGYLHGERDELVLAVSLAPVKEGVAASVGDRVREMSVSELLATVTESEDAVSIEGLTLDLALLEQMGENESSYEATREEFRADVRLAVIDQLVDEAYETRADDELLALVIDDYDPDAYTAAEKAAMVDQREAEIRAALESTIEAEAGDEVARLVDEELAATREDVRDSVSTELRSTEDIDPAVAQAATDLVMVGVDGLTTDMSYATYTQRLEEERSQLADAVEVMMAAQLDEELPDRMDVTDQLAPDAHQSIEVARGAVGLVSLLVYLLPLLGLGLLGLLWYATRSPVLLASVAGIALLAGGLPGYLVAVTVPGEVESSLAGQAPAEILGVVTGIVEQVAAAVAVQSLLFVAVGGVALVATAGLYATEHGLVDGVVGSR